MHTEDVPEPVACGERVEAAITDRHWSDGFYRFSNKKRAAAIHRHRKTCHGFSMTELVTVIATIGILASIIVVSFPDVNTKGKTVLAQQRLEMLNNALSSSNLSGRRIDAPANLSTATDEQLIVMTLQMRDESLVGSPFVIPNYRPAASSDAKDYRLRYNGIRFELLLPGQTGTGLKVAFDGSDLGPARVFPPNFRPYGS